MLVALLVPDFLTGRSFLQPPIDLLLLSTRLKRRGHSIRLLDNRVHHLRAEAIADGIRDADALVVSTGPYDIAQNYFVDYRILCAQSFINWLKKALPDKPLVLVGPHGTASPNIVFAETEADIVVRGEHEAVLPELFQRDIDLRSSSPLDEAIPGVISRAAPAAEDLLCAPPMDLNGVPPDYSSIDLRNYYGNHYVDGAIVRGHRWAVVLAQRGCPYRCQFCTNPFGRKLRRRSAGDVVEELRFLEREAGAVGVHFLDAVFTVDSQWVAELCEEMRRAGLKLSWTAQTRCDHADGEVLESMRGAGCSRIWLGIEHFSERIQERLRKYHGSEVIYRAIDACRSAGLPPSGFIMIGAPGEDAGSMEHNLDEVARNGLTYTKSIIICTPLLGSPLYDEYLEKGGRPFSTWTDIAAHRGLVLNELQPHDLMKGVSRMRQMRAGRR